MGMAIYGKRSLLQTRPPWTKFAHALPTKFDGLADRATQKKQVRSALDQQKGKGCRDLLQLG